MTNSKKNSQLYQRMKVNANMNETNQQSSLVYVLSKFDMQIQDESDCENEFGHF